MAARSWAMPAPVRADVVIRSGKAAGRLRTATVHGFAAFGELRLAHLVAFREDDLVTDGGLAQRVENTVIDGFEAMPRIDQHIDPRQSGAAMQIIVDEPGPGRDLALCRGRIAVARQIDQHEPFGAAEKDQFLGAARRVRGARQRAPAGKRVDQARFADIGAAGKCDFQATRAWQ